MEVSMLWFRAFLFLATGVGFLIIVCFLLRRCREKEDESPDQRLTPKEKTLIISALFGVLIGLSAVGYLIGGIGGMACVDIVTVAVGGAAILWANDRRWGAVRVAVIGLLLALIGGFGPWAYSSYEQHKASVAAEKEKEKEIAASQSQKTPPGTPPENATTNAPASTGSTDQKTDDSTAADGTKSAGPGCDESSPDGTGQPLAPPRPSEQPCPGQASGAGPAVPFQAPPPTVFKPTSGNRGSDLHFLVVNPCRYTTSNKITCTLSVTSSFTVQQDISLQYVDGSDDQGTKFSAYGTGRNLWFDGGGYSAKVQPTGVNNLYFTIDRSDTIKQIVFTLWWSPDGGQNKNPETFAQIPVAQN
jgi:hypothetical protein